MYFPFEYYSKGKYDGEEIEFTLTKDDVFALAAHYGLMENTFGNCEHLKVVTGDYLHCKGFAGGGVDSHLYAGKKIKYHGEMCSIVDVGSGRYTGIIKVKCRDEVIYIDESFNA